MVKPFYIVLLPNPLRPLQGPPHYQIFTVAYIAFEIWFLHITWGYLDMRLKYNLLPRWSYQHKSYFLGDLSHSKNVLEAWTPDHTRLNIETMDPIVASQEHPLK